LLERGAISSFTDEVVAQPAARTAKSATARIRVIVLLLLSFVIVLVNGGRRFPLLRPARKLPVGVTPAACRTPAGGQGLVAVSMKDDGKRIFAFDPGERP
jgi:hypothetical protein